MSDFQASMPTLLRQMPTDTIVRYLVKVLGTIQQIQYILAQLVCDVCYKDLTSERACRWGCKMSKPVLWIKVLCTVQDGTLKASLELRNERCIEAFCIDEEKQRLIKNYCLRFGAFKRPQEQQLRSQFYDEVLDIFYQSHLWRQMIFYCKPYSKVRKIRLNSRSNRAGNYQQTISIPSLLNKESTRDVFLNGEIVEEKVRQGPDLPHRIVQKPVICLKGLAVETDLSREALNFICLKRENKNGKGTIEEQI